MKMNVDVRIIGQTMMVIVVVIGQIVMVIVVVVPSLITVVIVMVVIPAVHLTKIKIYVMYVMVVIHV